MSLADADLDLDTPIWGAKRIAAAAGLFDENGEPNERAAYYQLEKYQREREGLPGRKVGERWVSSIRQIRSIALVSE